MADKVLINLATGMEDKERVLVAFLVATAALTQGKEVVVWTTKDARPPPRPARPDQGRAMQGLPTARPAVRPVRRGRRQALAVADLRPRARPGRRREGPERPDRRRDADVGVGGQRHDRLQLLTGGTAISRRASPLSTA